MGSKGVVSPTYRPDRSATLRKQTQTRKRTLHPRDTVRQLLHVAAELLTQGKWCCVLHRITSAIMHSVMSDESYLKVSTANFDDMLKLLGLDGERVSQFRESGN